MERNAHRDNRVVNVEQFDKPCTESGNGNSNNMKFGGIRKVLRTTLWPQTELKSTHYQETETNWLKSKRNQLANRKKSNLSIENKILVYKAVIKLVWTYGIELCGCASKSNTAIMQTAQ